MTRVHGFLFAAMLLASAGFHQPVDYDNTKSRYMLLGALVDEGRLSIDSHQQYTIDKAFFNGHYYTVKAIGLPFIAAPVYWLLRRCVLGNLASLPDPTILADPSAKYLVRVAVVSLPFAFLGLILLRVLIAMGAPPRNALWSVLAYAFGTIALNHAALFSGHQTAAFFLFSSFAILFLESRGGGPNDLRGLLWGLAAGLSAGCAVLCEYSLLPCALVLAGYALSAPISARAKGAFAVGAALCALALAIYNRACTGSFLTMSYAGFAFAPLREGTAQGVFGISRPSLDALFGELLSPARGLLFISPVLLFAAAGLSFMRRRAALRREFVAICLIVGSMVALYAGYFGWHGGWGFGPRYLVPVLPFLAVPMALAADGGPWFQLAFWPSVLQVACAQAGWPHAAPEIRNPLAEFIIPLMREGGYALTLLGGMRPIAAAVGIAQLCVVALLAGLALRGLSKPRARRLSWRWRAMIAAWSAAVALCLLFVRTPDAAAVHRYRGIVLNDAAKSLQSQELARAARAETLEGR